MKRVDLEDKLRALGWSPTGAPSGAHHLVWSHPRRSYKLYVPSYDLIFDATAERLLAQAGG